MWEENKYRKNEYLVEWWKDEDIRTFTHFYHVGPKESLRNEMTEALAIRKGYAGPAEFWDEITAHGKRCAEVQLSLFDDTEEGHRLP